MAIDRLNKVTILLPSEDSRWFLSKLYQLNIIHIIESFSQPNDLTSQHFKEYPTAVEDIEKNVSKLNSLLAIAREFVPKKKGFIEGIFPFPLQIRQDELDYALSRIDIGYYYKEFTGLYERYSNLQKRQIQLEEQRSKLADFLPVTEDIEKIKSIKNVSLFYGQQSKSKWNRLLENDSTCEYLTWQVISGTEKELKILFAYLKNDKDIVLGIFNKYSFKEIPFPSIAGNVKERINELTKDISIVKQEQKFVYSNMLKLVDEVRMLEILLGYWESEKNKMIAQRKCALTKRIFTLTGYIKLVDKPKLDTLINLEFQRVSVVYEEPSPQDKVPVSITLNKFFKPAQLLVNMFGLPNYFTFDPTPFIMISFLIFFGLCFGDVFYGLFLIAISAGMIKRYRASESFCDFMRLFFYAGISTTFFGIVTGGWAGDLYNPVYLGENNILLKIKERLTLLEPLSKPVVALLFAIGLGVLNQFYGIGLKMYGEFRKGNILNAVWDGLLWLITLPGFLILTSTLFLKMPAYVITIGKYMTIVGAVGLISTQGRNEKGIAGKIFTGIVSLYGIVGTYGCTSFISDVLSYTRILALSLTTTIVGMAFNIVALLFKTGTIIGTILFIIALVTGHMFNFFMSILSAFIHPARLIFLEFFGRFYEGGAPKFQPYGFNSQRIKIM